FAVSRRPYTDDSYVAEITPAVTQHYRHDVESQIWQDFSSRIHYIQVAFDQAEGYQELSDQLDKFSPKGQKSCVNKLFYLATKPTVYDQIFSHLKSSGLTHNCPEHGE